MKNRELSLHQTHEFMLKLEQAGLDPFLTQLVIDSPDNLLAKHLVASLLIKHFKINLSPWISLHPVSYERGELLAKYKKLNCKTKDLAGKMLNNQFTYTIDKLKLIALTYEGLGFADAQIPTNKEVYTRAQLLGLDLLPFEAGPILRLKYLQQPRDEIMLIGMEPTYKNINDAIINKEGQIFCLTNDIFGTHLSVQRFNTCLPVQKHKTKWVFALPN